MTRPLISLFVAAIVALMGSGVALGLTCEECREILKHKSDTEVELARQERELEGAAQRKAYSRTATLSEQIAGLRGKLINLRMREEECRNACKPDVVKEAECTKLMEQILALEGGKPASEKKEGSDAKSSGQKPEAAPPAPESTSPDTDTKKVDELYKALARCHKDLKRLKQTQLK